ncbi:metal-dependent transcriptional regulator [Candidatus Micrarchaeota archaeon]|nr:metal-dependent transcriptional regulator [Candidatus Micrarchaeota archaeon]
MIKKRTPQLEEYLETLVRYTEEGKEPKVKELAKDLNVSAASVSEMLKKLSKQGFVTYERYGKITLTKKGEKLGKTVLRKHRIIESFLTFIGVKKNKIHDEACILEHAISDNVEHALKSILTANKTGLNVENIRRLTDMKKGEKGKIIFVTGGAGACKRLTDLGLTPGTKITIGRASSRIGPVEICIRSSCLAIGRGLAEKIFIQVTK